MWINTFLYGEENNISIDTHSNYSIEDNNIINDDNSNYSGEDNDTICDDQSINYNKNEKKYNYALYTYNIIKDTYNCLCSLNNDYSEIQIKCNNYFQTAGKNHNMLNIFEDRHKIDVDMVLSIKNYLESMMYKYSLQIFLFMVI